IIQEDENISPNFNAERDVFFLLFTRLNPFVGQRMQLNDVNSILASNYDVRRPTRFIIHGFQSDSNTPAVRSISNAYLENSDLNVIVVDWGVGANTLNYATARARVNEVGPLIATFCDFMHVNNLLDFNRTYLIGGSLGAHVAGMAGKSLTRGKFNTIHGVDPAGPLFNVNDPSTRLAVGDAEYVECIHTDSRNFGIGDAICDADFFPNGGSNQPGCLTTLCDHGRAFDLFEESLKANELWGRRCSDANQIPIGCTGEGAYMEGEPSNFKNNIRGIFTLPTNNNSPFGLGRFSIEIKVQLSEVLK
ncbi:CLUMA_CG003192, isoform A, partial [Clunio marinus]